MYAQDSQTLARSNLPRPSNFVADLDERADVLCGAVVLVGVGEQAGFPVWVLGGCAGEREREGGPEGGHAGALTLAIGEVLDRGRQGARPTAQALRAGRSAAGPMGCAAARCRERWPSRRVGRAPLGSPLRNVAPTDK